MTLTLSDMENVALHLGEMLDDIYMHSSKPTGYSIRIGVWSTEDTPYSIYAGLYSDDGDTIVAGESSYGSFSLEEAINRLHDEVAELWAGAA